MRSYSKRFEAAFWLTMLLAAYVIINPAYDHNAETNRHMAKVTGNNAEIWQAL